MLNASDLALTIAACSTRKDLYQMLIDGYKNPASGLLQKFSEHTGVDVSALNESALKELVMSSETWFTQMQSKFDLTVSFCSDPPCPDSRTFLAMAYGVKIRELPKPGGDQTQQAK